MGTEDLSEPVIVVSADTHVGPRMVEDLRPYCPHRYLDEFDRFTKNFGEGPLAGIIRPHPNRRTAGHYDSAARLADYDYDGVAAGVLFHGSQNAEAIPFVDRMPRAVHDPELESVGQHIYNEWLIDFVATAPHRHIGLAHLPMWDVDAAVAEAEWAHDKGLHAVNFPAMREGVIPEYNDRAWEPLWSVCSERQMPLVTHVGGGSHARYTGPERFFLVSMETGGWLARRAIWWLIFAGVFERHPGLKLVITETPGNWWPATADELDSIYEGQRQMGLRWDDEEADIFRDQIPRRPSEYMAENVYFTASFAAPFEVEQAVVNGVDSRLMWGSDYPHVEGTFVYPEATDMPSVTRLALRNTFCEVDSEAMRRMVGGNAIDLFGLDREALTRIAHEIGAATAAEIATPISVVPAGASTTAFRTGIWV